jgi:hypothetical protein
MSRNHRPSPATPAPLAGQRDVQLIILVEAAMLGYALARKAHRTS